MSDTFKQDLPIGEEAEYKVLAMVRKKYPNAYKMKGKFKPYDIYVPDNDMKIEVKWDIKSNKYIWIKKNKLLTIASWYGKRWEGIPEGGASIVKSYLVPKNNIIICADKITTPHESSG